MPHFVYILYSAHLDNYYIGSAADPLKRLAKHLSNHKGFTARAKDWRICHTEAFELKSEALGRERQLKAWKNRVRIEELISKHGSSSEELPPPSSDG